MFSGLCPYLSIWCALQFLHACLKSVPTTKARLAARCVCECKCIQSSSACTRVVSPARASWQLAVCVRAHSSYRRHNIRTNTIISIIIVIIVINVMIFIALIFYVGWKELMKQGVQTRQQQRDSIHMERSNGNSIWLECHFWNPQ